jgi:hypothetical protein
VLLRVFFQLGLAFWFDGNQFHDAFRLGVRGASLDGSEPLPP